jgi:hypothetical protein
MAAMPRYDIFANPNKTATHPFYIDVQSDLVRLSTRWCIPLLRRKPAMLALPGVQALIKFHEQQYLMDTGNLLAVPALLLQRSTGRLSSDQKFLADSCIEFMLRGY